MQRYINHLRLDVMLSIVSTVIQLGAQFHIMSDTVVLHTLLGKNGSTHTHTQTATAADCSLF